MTPTPPSVSTAAALAGLKDFQRETVEYVFERLYAENGPRRFLVADEVGLGKTLIARGVIAKAIDHLRGKVDRIDIVYVCSNGDIARQNINRLKVEGEHVAFASRLTLLPFEVERLRQTKTGANFVSFTPTTSFDVAGGLGRMDERVLLYAFLRTPWELGSRAGPMNVFQGNASTKRFREQAQGFDLANIDPQGKSQQAFEDALTSHDATALAAARPTLRERFDALARAYAREDSSPGGEIAAERSRFIGELRVVLAASCIAALEPDLIILDEFQRFGHLLEGEDESSRLARELFEFKDVAVLLLSATPYKMYTSADEAEGEDHYRDFVRTLRFLERSDPTDKSLDGTLAGYRRALLAAGEPEAEERVRGAKSELQARLRKVMVRTERLASTIDRNGMLVERSADPAALVEGDVRDYLALQSVARQLKQPDVIEYWKSAPFVLNFMDEGYKLKRELDEAAGDGQRRMALARSLAAGPTAALPWQEIERYGGFEVGNGRARAILDDTIGRGAHRLLWIPPSLPYYQLGGAFAEEKLRGFTKRLVFSSWKLVPRAIAALVSYEAERRMVGRARDGANTPEARKKRARLLRFGRSPEGRLTGMPVLALMYPSSYLAHACDPARIAADDGRGMSIEALLEQARENIEVGLRRIPTSGDEDGPVDERWYWAAPLMLDQALEPEPTRAWFGRPNLADRWAGRTAEEAAAAADDDGEGKLWDEHVEAACAFAREQAHDLGRRPDDLVDVLARIAVAAPGVTMLRAMLRVVGMRTNALRDEAGVNVRDGAARAAWSFRGLFNQPEVMALLANKTDPYWRRALDYCVDGCLQAVLDEYAHVLRDHLGLSRENAGAEVHQIAEQICEAMSLRTANLGVTDLGLSESGRTLQPTTKRMRCHFALRFGDEKTEDGAVATRADSVRKAFNSPFWPFVVATTSVGQEGLDFHTYCHAVVHWNLPWNPVDLEQREGRVHRYKGHAVRKNVAMVHGASVLADDEIDAWEALFEAARRERPDGATDIVPYWVYAPEGGARIERHVPMLPLSRERQQLIALSKSLAVYRMVFGQPRQDDLMRFLLARVDEGTRQRLLDQAKIDLSPAGAR